MKLGLFAINSGACAESDVAIEVAQASEAAGLESVWTGEHVVLPDPQVAPSPVGPFTPFLDPAVALAFIAARTTTIKLGTGIIIVPQRNALVLAKEMASLDVVSKGRLLFGIGVGYLEPEFRALGKTLEHRGAKTIETLEAMREIWNAEHPRYEGQHVSFSGVQARPVPIQRPTPPIHMGGNGPAGWRKAVTHAHGWYGFNRTLEQTVQAITGIAQARRDFERPEWLGSDIEISITPVGPIDAATVAAYSALGVDRLIILPSPRADRAGLLTLVEQLATMVDC
jgi:probable F420-dependent oxidoreductase